MIFSREYDDICIFSGSGTTILLPHLVFFAHAEGLSTESGAKESSIMKTMGSDWDDDGRSTGILMVINGDLNCDLMVISGN